MHSPGTLLSGGGSTASTAACMASHALVSLSCSSLCLTRVVGGGGCLPHVAATSPATRSRFPVSLSSTPARVSSSHCSCLLAWLSCWPWLDSDGVGVGVHDAMCLCWVRSDGGVGCGLVSVESGGGGGGCACVTTVTMLSHSMSGLGLGLERRFAAWNLLYLTTMSLSTAFFSCSFLALNFSRARASRSSARSLCDLVPLFFNADFQSLLKEGMNSGELGPKQLLSKTGMSRDFFFLVVVEKKNN